ncbi:MAG: replication-associated recombination protein A [Candidatus Aminicenantes bacterium]|nr:replication-associated recombination protein A [Candidatus Aminicenantes bacterium]
MDDKKEKKQVQPPLAERMRPRSFARFYGQEHLLGKGRIITELMESGHLVSLIFWGPPGSGKTTLGYLLAQHFNLPCLFFSAVLASLKEIKEFMAQAESHKKLYGQPSILFIDEIHRFNKAQQGAFLPYVERGEIILFGSTTENPSFEVIAPLLSRTKVLVLQPLDEVALNRVIDDALQDEENGLGQLRLTISPEAKRMIISQADGDARRALNTLELAANLAHGTEIGLKEVEEALQKKTLLYDKDGEEHYNLLSALHKSLRNSDVDASLYWLARMLAAGEDPLVIARRLVRFAAEDVGLADPMALNLALAAKDVYDFLGSPEGELALAEAVIYLATAPKSNRVYVAFEAAMKDARNGPYEPVPLHLRNPVTSLMKSLGYGQGYEYAHDHPEKTSIMETMPPRFRGRRYYRPGEFGLEKEIKKRLEWWERIKEKLKQEAKLTAPSENKEEKKSD